MKNTRLLLWCAILVAAVSGYGIYSMARNLQQSHEPHRVPIDYKKLARESNLGPLDFVLTNQDDKLFYSNKELKGKVWILNFFFSTCTQNCHRTNLALAELQRKFPNDDLMIVSVSCTPELDSTDILKSYAQQFHANLNQWQFLTGNFDEIKTRIAKRFLLTYERGAHQDKIVVVGRDGVTRDIFEILNPEENEKLVKDLQTWLDEPAPKESTPMTSENQKNDQLKDRKMSNVENKTSAANDSEKKGS